MTCSTQLVGLTFITSVGLVFGGVSIALAQSPAQPVRFVAPDDQVVAVVVPVNDGAESVVEIRDQKGRVRLKRSFASPDGEHGLWVVRSAWSADSRFFVFTTTSSGGHRPWTSPMFIYVRSRNQLVDMQKCDLVVADSNFEIMPPDLLSVRVWILPIPSDWQPLSRTARLTELLNSCDAGG